MAHYINYQQKEIELTDERWKHIVGQHPEVEDLKDKISEVLKDPDYVKRSLHDPSVVLYYRFFSDLYDGKYLLIVSKEDLERRFVLTGYITDQIKEGETIWQRKI